MSPPPQARLWTCHKIRSLSLSPRTRVPGWLPAWPRAAIGPSSSQCFVHLRPKKFGSQSWSSESNGSSPLHKFLHRRRVPLQFWHPHVASAQKITIARAAVHTCGLILSWLCKLPLSSDRKTYELKARTALRYVFVIELPDSKAAS